MIKNKVFVISGPTASGKTFFAIQLAKKYNAVILNADSMQIYKNLPILSAQPDTEELCQAEHRLYNILEINQSNSVFNWLELIVKESKDIFTNEKNIVIIGGTGMYISRLLNGMIDLPNTDQNLRNELNKKYEEVGYEKFYKLVNELDEESVKKIQKNDKQRLIRIYEIYQLSGKKLSVLEKTNNNKIFKDGQIFHINLFPDREILYERCERRFNLMIKDDLVINEVSDFIIKNKNYLDSNIKYSVFNTIGFYEIKDFLENKISREEMVRLTVKSTKNYAKRQFTWFRNQFKNVDYLIDCIPNKDNYLKLLENINNELVIK